MRPRALAPLLLAAALLPPAGAAAQLRAATLNVAVTVIRRVEIDVTRATPAAARAGGERLVFIDDAPPSLVVELRGEVSPRPPGERGPDLAASSPRWHAPGSGPPVALTDLRERPAGRRGVVRLWRGGGRRS